MKLTLLLLLPMVAAIGLVPCARGQSSPGDEAASYNRRMPAEYEEAARQLRDMPALQYDFAKSNLGDVLRFLATDAKISFISLPDSAPEANLVITFSIYGSPFQVLETLCKANALSLIPENGMWYIRPADDRELIGRAYTVKNNAMERVQKVTSTSGGSSGGSSGGGGDGSILGASVDLQGAQDTFKVSRSELITDIRSILDLAPEKLDANGAVTQGASSSTPSSSPLGGISESNSNNMSSLHQPKVIWKSDSNTLYVVATRLQHLWVAGYLAAADKPQPLIAIEVKFVETSHDPSKELGLDWNGTFGQTGTFRQITDTSVDPSTGIGTIKSSMQQNTDGGYRTDLSVLTDFANLNKSASALKYPGLAAFAGQDLSVKVRALLSDNDTKTTSYPRMITLNNREVVIRSVVNQPILAGTASVGGSGGGAASTAQSITYLPIGTVLNILPKKMQDEKVLLNMSITVSNIISQTLIGGNNYPVATSRVYSAPVEVENGYTVAVGGLDEAKEQQTGSGIPVLSRIPVVGYLFGSKARTNNHKNLMLFITPTLIDSKGGGLTEEPISVVPHKPGDKLLMKPQIGANGTLAGGPDAVPSAVAYLTHECDKIQATIDEARITDQDSHKLTEMKLALNQLEGQVEAFATQYPAKSAMLLKATTDIAVLHDRVGKMKWELRKKAFY
ncbi:MAG: hypothetical protein JWO94_3073 [Verrucomicrobiaceae bacterium]|nr:hypothetical protein [Verrucomicrobiaceae bacterium]